jgi:FkbM family methyltransferase
MLNDRPLWLIARNVARINNYAALARMNRVYESPVAAASRYFLGRGEYPCSAKVRTPTGPQLVTLFNSHDAITLHEIFCREDYRCPSAPQTVVDLGSNIGVSALYFLTRSPSAYCELYEPDPRNVSKLLLNLRSFYGRYTLHESAVADTEGTFPFGREPTGRYGHLDARKGGSCGDSVMPGESLQETNAPRIDVRVEHINTVLENALSLHGAVDLLKIDTEGAELPTLRAIYPALLGHIRYIVIECFDHRVRLDGFEASWSCDTVMFRNENFEGK